MNKIEKLRDTIEDFFRANAGDCYVTENQINHAIHQLQFPELYSSLCDLAQPVFCFTCICNAPASMQFFGNKLLPMSATLIWNSAGKTVERDDLTSVRFHEAWLMEDMTIAITSCFRLINPFNQSIVEYREYKGKKWPGIEAGALNVPALYEALREKYIMDNPASDGSIVIFES